MKVNKEVIHTLIMLCLIIKEFHIVIFQELRYDKIQRHNYIIKEILDNDKVLT